VTVTNGPLIAAIETSCDDTSVALVRGGREELALKSQTQIEPHAAMGGIVPEAAARIHVEAIDAVWHACLSEAGVDAAELDALAVTQGPGLPGSLLVGLGFAQGLAAAVNFPLIPVNHLEGHFASPWLNEGDPPEFPLVALIVSGGHTELVYGAAPGEYRLIGRTRDDAAGEAFDKVARMLGLSYPGGPAIQRAAEGRDGSPLELPRAWLPGTSDFSFSGLKTAVARHLQRRRAEAAGTIKQGMRALWVANNLRVPSMCVHIRKCYGMAGNEKTLDTFLRYHHAQGLSPRRVEVEELFHPATLEAFSL